MQTFTNNAKPHMKYFMYARKSTDSEDRQVASIDSQIGELLKIAGRDDLDIVERFAESKSAKAPGRPVFNQMIKRIDRGEAQGIICWKLDRLARNPIDGGTISWMLQRGKLLHIQTYDRAYLPTDNVLMMSVEFGMANQYVRDLATNVKRELRRKAEMGWRPGQAPTGYLNSPDKEKGKRIITPDPNLFPALRRMIGMILARTHTLPQVHALATNQWCLRNRNGRKIALSTFYRMLSLPFYYGAYEYPGGSGIWHHGNHEPLLTKAEFDKLQAIIKSETTTRPKSYFFAYRGLLHCAQCGALVTAENKHKRTSSGRLIDYIYYHCTRRKDPNCRQKCIEEKDLEKQAKELLERIEIPQDFCDWAVQKLRGECGRETEMRANIIDQQRKAYDQCVQKLDKLLELRLSGEIDEDQFLAKKEELIKEKARLTELLRDSDNRVDAWLIQAEKALNFAQTARESFESGDDTVKREILAALGTNWTLKDGKLDVLIEEPLRHIGNCAKMVRTLQETSKSGFEPEKNAARRRETSGSAYECLKILRD
ncbi:MAG: hypothetical protein A2X28_06470 [Elusimicrobia bacterium GWA2_56_46]|nr:MAG: hypothetical protein A2X28_06470 [Elusimicrobia bacterium GWA2_56_46]OGR54902.1 MAG: hypothetical protein A2X39_11520 [Elusimicrobia bacterium GWC2_56_31]HBW23302.1 hypothetical protein [Elusimicrobiota bacterium]